MLYLDTEYEQMEWAIHRTPLKSSVLDDFLQLRVTLKEAKELCPPEGKKYDWQKYITDDQMMRYIVYCYHYHSPIAQKNADIAERKKKAFREAGVDLQSFENKADAKEVFANIILSRHEFVSHLALHFLKQENNLAWMEMCRLNELIYDTYLMLQVDDSGGKKSAAENAKYRADAYAKSKIYSTDLQKLSKELFQEDLALKNFIASHILREKRMALITPERVAKRIEENGGVPSEDFFESNPNK